MNTIDVKPNQTMPDIILMAFGTMECGMQFLLANNKSITEVPFIGNSFDIPDTLIPNGETMKYLTQNGVVIGTKG